MNKLKLYLIIGLHIFTVGTFAQNPKLHYDIKWHEKQTFFAPDTEKSNKYLLYFEGAIYNHYINHLPVFSKNIPIPQDNKKVQLINKKYLILTQKDISKVYDADKITETIQVKNSVVHSRKQNFLQFSFVPIRKNPTTGQYEKLVSFDVKLVDTAKKRVLKNAANSYKNTSVLSSGKWVKIKVDKSGVYKLTHENLKEMGINNLSNVRIFGNGGKILPFYNSEPKPDDLIENDILIKDDAVYFYATGVVQWEYFKDEDYFKQNINLYSNYAYYFVTDDYNSGNDNKIRTENEPSAAANKNVNTFNALAYHEKESINLIGSGRLWVGESLDFPSEYDFNFDIPNLVQGSTVTLRTSLVARSPIQSSFNISFEGGNFSTILPAVDYGYISKYASQKVDKFATAAISPNNIKVKISYNKSTSSSEAWIDYVTVNARRKLIYTGEQLDFRDTSN